MIASWAHHQESGRRCRCVEEEAARAATELGHQHRARGWGGRWGSGIISVGTIRRVAMAWVRSGDAPVRVDLEAQFGRAWSRLARAAGD
jgi:hypothetical protein